MFVVTLPRSAEKHPLAFAKAAKRAGADVLEIRGDLTPDVQPFLSPLPILATPRGSRLPSLKPQYIDLAPDELPAFRRQAKKPKLILSFHHYEKTPTLSRLKVLVRRLKREKPWAVKIATFVRSYDDLAPLFALQSWLKRAKIRSIVLGMGEKAHLSRVVSPFRNTFTYAALDGYEASASGQLPLSFYELIQGRKNPKLFGILGGPHITASQSPMIHNTLFTHHGIDAVYSSFPCEEFGPAMKALTRIGISGLSVTAPFKRDAFKYCDVPEAVAMTLGVANTLVRSGKTWKGFNTDWYGILSGYPELRSAKSVAILGAGGAVPSAILAVREANPDALITVFARDLKKARQTLAPFGVSIAYISDSRTQTADIVICAISADVTLSFPKPADRKSIAIDLRYGKVTRFLVAAKKAGYRTRDGAPMLIHQALRQFRKFTGNTPDQRDPATLTRLLSSSLHGQ